ncbi:cytidylate kinase-like family protein [Limibacter armeniacum]|uniref:cytidylate kinase-like family protein n=1 Tax=Limibacter armeniacum TaxID=466084 RepID=UPI002FE51DAA
METISYDYFSQYFKKTDEELNKPIECNGKVVTIGRDYGCNAMEVAQQLVDKLNTNEMFFGHPRRWQVVDSEVIRAVGKEMKMNLDRVTDLSTPQRKGLVDQLLSAFNEYQPHKELKRAMGGVISAYMERGNVVFVGRGAGFFAEESVNVLNVKLFAPLRYRVRMLMQKEGMSEDKAIELVELMDDKRSRFNEFLSGASELHYDILLDRSRISTNGIVNMLYSTLEEMPEF